MVQDVFSKIKISTKLNLLVFVMCTAIVGIGTYGGYELRVMDRNAQTLYADRVLPLQQLTTMRYAYVNNILSCAQNINNHRLTFAAARKQVEAARDTIDTNWNAYLHTYLTPEEKQLAQKAGISINETDGIVKRLEEVLAKEDPDALDKINDGLYPAVNSTISGINSLLNLQVRVSGEVYQNSREIYASTATKFAIIIGLLIAFAIPLVYFIVKDAKYLIWGLEASNRKIAESEAKCRAFIEHAGDAILMFDKDYGRITDVNNSACRLLGYSRNELLHMKNTDIVPREELEKQAAVIEELRTYKGSIHERKCRRKDGSLVDTEVNIQPIPGMGSVAIIRDITERKKAEQTISESEEKYRSLVEHAGDAIFIIGEDTSIQDANRSAGELVGYTNRELLGMHALDLYPPEVRTLQPIQWDELRKNKTLFNERQLQRKDGSRVDVEVSRRLLNNGKGYLAIVRDITDRKKAEEKLRQSEERLRAFVENIGDVIMMVNKRSELVYHSPSFKRVLGYTPEDVSGKLVFDIVHGDDSQRCIDFFLKVYATPGTALQDQFRIRHKDGHYVWIEGTVMNLFSNESVGALIVNFRDITDRKMTEEKLRQSEERHRALIENIGDAINVADENAELVYRSPSAVRLNGYTIDDLKGKKIDATIHPDDRQAFSELLAKVYATPGIPLQYQYRWQDKKGHYNWIEGTMTNLLHLESVKGIVINSRDITARKNAEAEIMALNEGLEQKVTDRTAQLQEANKALEAFSYSVSHDLRAPLRSILGFTNIIEEDYGATFDEHLKELFGFINVSGTRMNNIIEDMLTLAKFDQEKLRLAPVNMNKLVGHAWDNVLLQSAKKPAFELSALPEITADASMLEQVLINLLSNAVKYSSKKEDPRVTVGFEKGNDTITFFVKDNGAGFDMKNYGRLFGAFQRLHGSSEFEGTGVGLTLVKRIIEKHGGTVWAEGKVNEGATFYFAVPG